MTLHGISNRRPWIILRILSLLGALVLFLITVANAAGQPEPNRTYSVIPHKLSIQTRSLLPRGVDFKPGSSLIVFSEQYSRDPLLVPKLEGRETIVRHIQSHHSTPLLIEAIVLLPYSRKPLAGNNVAERDRDPSVEELSLLFNQFASLQGIQYWSASRSRLRTLYVTSYRISDPLEKKKIEDPRT
ncbi:MAG: hypothetical protein N3A02_01560, partial [Rectinema sp.]|nr:hypothetical protein [Rectinema sp.]